MNKVSTLYYLTNTVSLQDKAVSNYLSVKINYYVACCWTTPAISPHYFFEGAKGNNVSGSAFICSFRIKCYSVSSRISLMGPTSDACLLDLHDFLTFFLVTL